MDGIVLTQSAYNLKFQFTVYVLLLTILNLMEASSKRRIFSLPFSFWRALWCDNILMIIRITII